MLKDDEVKIEKKSIKKILYWFKRNITWVELYFNNFLEIAINKDEWELKRSKEFLENLLKQLWVQKNLNGSIDEKTPISNEQINLIVQEFRKKPKITIANFEILSSSSFLVLNNYFEYLLSDLLSYYYTKYKDSLSWKESRLTIKEISEYSSVEELLDASILKNVETILFDLTFDQLLEHFKNELKIDLEEKIINWPKIKEYRERRHLIVHNSWVVNKKYIIKSWNPYNLKVGDQVKITKEYFKEAIENYKIAWLILNYSSWGEWDKETADEAISEIMIETFNLLKEDEFVLVNKISEYVSNKIIAKNESQEDILLRIKINNCIALKKLKLDDDLNKSLKWIKIWTVTPIFKLAHSILSNKDNEIIIEYFKKAIALDEINKSYYAEWPIFDFIRTKKTLNKKIVTLFKN